MRDTRLQGAAEAAARDWFRRACADPTIMSAYYKPGGMAFWIGHGPLNDSWRKFGEVRASMSERQVVAWLLDEGRRLPLYPSEA